MRSIWLASNSPRRKELLALFGWDFQVKAEPVDERPLLGETAGSYVSRLAREKVLRAASPANNDGLIIAADTAVVDGEEILGKPADRQEAVRMLRQLRGRTHLVYTGLAVLQTSDGNIWEDVCVTEVPVRAATEAEIEAYVSSGDALDKAGAYAIQHAGFHPVEGLAGCYANVMGLPLCHVTRILRKTGLRPEMDIAAVCQEKLQYDCPVYHAILNEDYRQPA